MNKAEIEKIAAEDTKQSIRFVIAQFIISVVLATVLFLYDFTAAYSGLVGGMIATLANGWFALKVFTANSRQPAQMLRSFYWAEINKLFIIGSLFIAVFVMLEPLNAAALLAAYFLVHMVPAVLAAIHASRHRDTYIKNNEESQ